MENGACDAGYEVRRRTDNQRKLTSMRAAKSIPELSESDKRRFLAKISTVPTEQGCLEWTACKHEKKGYGMFWLGSGQISAHRVAYFLATGSNPGELQVNHHCDNPACCNAAHHYLGTQFDNVRDRVTRGRSNSARGDSHGSRTKPESRARGERNGQRTHPERTARGEAQGSAKLKEPDIIAIRADPRSQTKIAASYGVSRPLIGYIKRRETWKHVA